MNTSVSAVVLTRGTSYPPRAEVDETIVHPAKVVRPIDFLIARFEAARRVRTSHFFFLDDDDSLPADAARVLGRCAAAAAPVAYTDRIVRTAQGDELVRGEPYSQAAHLRNPRLVHQLALYETAAALQAVDELPRGDYYPELLLGWQVAKRGAAYVPEAGYIWHRGNGLHRSPAASISQGRAILWCKEHP